MRKYPSWICKKGKREILAFIKACPSGFEVDHIIPVNGPNVCGLHILENLQYLPKSVNNRKRERICTFALEYAACPLPIGDEAESFLKKAKSITRSIFSFDEAHALAKALILDDEVPEWQKTIFKDMIATVDAHMWRDYYSR
jgi:hypothetical protein